jgi:cAMP receptor-like G-protein coupled receptor
VAAEASAAMSQGLSDRDILDAVGTTAAALSLAGSSFIVLCYLLFRELRKFSFKLVFFLAVSVSEPDLGALGSGL